MAIPHCYCYSLYRQINWQIYPTVLISSGQEWQFHIATVTAHIGTSTGRSPPHQSNTNALCTVTPNLADLLAYLPPSIEHRCLEYCYKLGRSNPHQSSTDALSTVTPNLADLPPSIEHRCLSTITPHMADLPPINQA